MKSSIKSFLTDEIDDFLIYIWENFITDYLEIILSECREIPLYMDEQIDEKNVELK